MPRYRVLVVSNSISENFGYSVVARHVVHYLKQYYDIFFLGMQSVHPPYKSEGIVHLGTNADPFCSDCLEDYLKAYDIDVLITIFDLWLPEVSYLPSAVSNSGVRWIAHVTVNTSPMPGAISSILRHSHLQIAPSMYVLGQLRASGFPDALYIPHGVDTFIFRPKKTVKEDDGFIFLSVMRNKGGIKDFPSLFKAYQMLIERNEYAMNKSKLIILSDPLEPGGMNLYHLRKLTNTEKKVMFIGWKPSEDNTSIVPCVESEGFRHFANMCFSREVMSEIYSLSDCLVSSSAGESFNLPALEALACGVPVILPDNTTAREITDNGRCGLLAKIQYHSMNYLYSFQSQVSVQSLCGAMDRVIKDGTLRKRMSLHGIAHAGKYSWDRILPKWREAVEKALDLPTDYQRGVLGI